jgi:hypothetical protein
MVCSVLNARKIKGFLLFYITNHWVKHESHLVTLVWRNDLQTTLKILCKNNGLYSTNKLLVKGYGHHIPHVWMFMIFNFRKFKDKDTHGYIPCSFRKLMVRTPCTRKYSTNTGSQQFDGMSFKIHMRWASTCDTLMPLTLHWNLPIYCPDCLCPYFYTIWNQCKNLTLKLSLALLVLSRIRKI